MGTCPSRRCPSACRCSPCWARSSTCRTRPSRPTQRWIALARPISAWVPRAARLARHTAPRCCPTSQPRHTCTVHLSCLSVYLSICPSLSLSIRGGGAARALLPCDAAALRRAQEGLRRDGCRQQLAQEDAQARERVRRMKCGAGGGGPRTYICIFLVLFTHMPPSASLVWDVGGM